MAYSVKKQQKKQLFKEGQKAVQDVRKSIAPKVTQLGPSKRAKLTLTREVLAKSQPSTNTLRPKKLKKTAKRKKR